LDKEKKGEVTRMPPTTMEEAQKGLCTYSHFLSMVGFVNNAHYEGVMEIRRALNELSTRKDNIKGEFYMSVMWMVTDDQCKHFSECMVMEDFEGEGHVNWPRTNLKRFADRMRDRETIDLIDLPRQWRTWLAKKTNPWAGEQGGGRGRGGRGGQGQPTAQQTSGDPTGGGGRKPGGGPPAGKDFGVKRWNAGAHPKVKKLIESLKGKDSAPRNLFRAAGKRNPDFRTWPGKKEGDPVWCPEWTLGGCHEEKCSFVHDNAKTPVEYIDWICGEVKPGVDALIEHDVDWRPPRPAGGKPKGRRD
jgi:hypothetical protein